MHNLGILRGFVLVYDNQGEPTDGTLAEKLGFAGRAKGMATFIGGEEAIKVVHTDVARDVHFLFVLWWQKYSLGAPIAI